eukprot:CAMPEP_0114238904 /NCGR_PEP_ID=MMETSP0058-20121206/8168_1 /TAXON_ID=36894 /ORGANISM="Pyramimonas parkeae, CCMP726" /LENGTH=84 /DNA_ID=CAMNT_0001351035 /DNA_START=101 /DNA_END=355 /DNA_ORIENTATION=+
MTEIDMHRLAQKPISCCSVSCEALLVPEEEHSLCSLLGIPLDGHRANSIIEIPDHTPSIYGQSDTISKTVRKLGRDVPEQKALV